jgi:hypothetical protein
MTKEDIIRMAREAQLGTSLTHKGGEQRVWIEGADWHDELERFAALVAEHERERIIAANAPEIERINAYIKELEEAVAAEREACAKVVEAIERNGAWVTKEEAAEAIRARS